MEHTPNGILLIDKAEGWTSHDVVAKARRTLGTRKIGHAGTLDPMATGLLLLGVGPSTRLLTHMVGLDKTYTATIRLGYATVTDDREGEVLERSAGEQRDVMSRIAALLSDPTPIRSAVELLTGDIEQAPSAVSAIKVDGRRAYDRVREGEQVELKKRPVTVYSFDLGEPRSVPVAETEGADAPVILRSQRESQDLTGTSAPLIDIDATIRCSTGTYVRALARDLGAMLGVGGHLTALRRTTVGPFDVADAYPNSALAAEPGQQAVDRSALLSAAEVAGQLFPVIELSSQQEVDLGHGKRFEVDREIVPDAKLAAAIAPSGRLVGLIEVKRGRTRVVTNFPTPATEPVTISSTRASDFVTSTQNGEAT